MKTNRDERKRTALDYLSIVAGCAVLASAYPMFLVPCHIAPGGVSGISTILHADQIIVLNEGRIDGIGTHEQLMRACRTCQEIAHSQLSAKELGLEGGMA